jgi:hypothetical protein
VAALAAAAPAHAVVFGVFGDSALQANAAAVAGGHTSSVLVNLSAGNLAGLNVLWVLNGDNGSHIAALVGNAAVSSFVSGGGVLMYHDRFVTGANTVLPGGGSIAFTRSPNSSIDVQTVVNPLITGPGGTISNATLDGGSSSNHGSASLGSLPAGSVAYLNNGTPGQIVDFSYGFGNGSVYYSSIPLDFYLNGGGSNGASFRNIYTPNVIAQAASLGGGAVVPEPASWAMLITGFGLVGATQRRRRRAAVAA